MARNKPVRPSRPLLEVNPLLHHELKIIADNHRMPLKELTHELLSNGVLRIQAGALRIERQTRVVDETQTTLPLE